jgi:hypothetical protein
MDTTHLPTVMDVDVAIQKWHRSLQTLYETVNIQRACIICMNVQEATDLYKVLDAHDFPVQLCISEGQDIPPHKWDLSKRLYIVSRSTPIPWILVNDEVNMVCVCAGETEDEQKYAVLGLLYTYSQQCCNRPVFFISL